jgi:hypothetical protein
MKHIKEIIKEFIQYNYKKVCFGLVLIVIIENLI